MITFHHSCSLRTEAIYCGYVGECVYFTITVEMLLCKFWRYKKCAISYLFSRMFVRHCGARWKAFVAQSWTLLQMGRDVARRRWCVSLRKEGGRAAGIEFLGRAGEKALESSCFWVNGDHIDKLARGNHSLPLYLLSLPWKQSVKERGLSSDSTLHLQNICSIFPWWMSMEFVVSNIYWADCQPSF